MPFTLNYITPSTGAPASFHIAQNVSLDSVAQQTSVTVASYYSQADQASGKFAMFQQQIAIAGLPPTGQDAFEFSEAQLIAPEPTDGTASTATNRYVFAGGALVAPPTVASAAPAAPTGSD